MCIESMNHFLKKFRSIIFVNDEMNLEKIEPQFGNKRLKTWYYIIILDFYPRPTRTLKF